jgi:hypothetical protein
MKKPFRFLAVCVSAIFALSGSATADQLFKAESDRQFDGVNSVQYQLGPIAGRNKFGLPTPGPVVKTAQCRAMCSK